jgi:hypothetical protein
MAKVVRLTESDLVNLVKRVLEEQTQNFPGDDEGRMKQILDSQLLKVGFKTVGVPSSGTKQMCKTAYKYPTFKGDIYLSLRCCGPNEPSSTIPGKCGHVVVQLNDGRPTMVKSFDINGFAMDSRDGANTMFDLDEGKLQKAIDYALQLKLMMRKKFDASTT